MIRVAHVITSLGVGGAEMTLYRLLARMNRTRFASEVFSLAAPSTLAAKIEKLGVPVRTGDMNGVIPAIRGIISFTAAIRKFRPDIIQTWLYHADFVGLVVSRLTGARRLCWNLRCAGLRPGDVSPSALRMTRALSRCSRLPDAVVANSRAGIRAHESIGYRPRRWVLLYNGFDTELFRPDADARSALRRDFGLRPDVSLIGMVARFDPMKDHTTFLRAARQLAAVRPDARFVLIGRGMDSENPTLARMIAASDFGANVLLLGERADVFRLMPGLDVVVSASYGEGLPNVIGEAMACGVPCAATDVGDTRLLVGDAGILVPPRDADALANACIRLLDLSDAERAEMGQRARERIMRDFSLDGSVRRYEQLYEELAAK